VDAGNPVVSYEIAYDNFLKVHPSTVVSEGDELDHFILRIFGHIGIKCNADPRAMGRI
jgi:hypothetical protein